jgi:hypothetical protein
MLQYASITHLPFHTLTCAWPPNQSGPPKPPIPVVSIGVRMRGEMRWYRNGVLGCYSGQSFYKNHQVTEGEGRLQAGAKRTSAHMHRAAGRKAPAAGPLLCVFSPQRGRKASQRPIKAVAHPTFEPLPADLPLCPSRAAAGRHRGLPRGLLGRRPQVQGVHREKLVSARGAVREQPRCSSGRARERAPAR